MRVGEVLVSTCSWRLQYILCWYRQTSNSKAAALDSVTHCWNNQ